MKVISIFNFNFTLLFFPAHDIALGHGVRHYTPAARIQRLQADLAWLQEVWNNPAVQPDPMPLPWGWNWDTREYMARTMHIGRENLPTDGQLEALRQLSHRRTSIRLLEALGFSGQMPEYLDSAEKLSDFIARMDAIGQEFVLKSPWSSSGRGLMRSEAMSREVLIRQALATITTMGGIMGEAWFAKEMDFAMLFRVGHSDVHFLGYSLFENAENCTYRTGYLLSNQAIVEKIGEPELASLSERLREALANVFRPFFGLPWQVGYIGVTLSGANPTNSMMSISPQLGQPISRILVPIIQLAGHMPRPVGSLARTSIRP